METIFEAARELQGYCDQRGWRSCFIGGIAVQRWGEVRVTRDVDLTLLTGFGTETSYVESLLTGYASRHADPLQFALIARVLLLNSAGGIGLDISLGALPFEEHMIDRATCFEFSRPGTPDVFGGRLDDSEAFRVASARPPRCRDRPAARASARLAVHRRTITAAGGGERRSGDHERDGPAASNLAGWTPRKFPRPAGRVGLTVAGTGRARGIQFFSFDSRLILCASGGVYDAHPQS